MQDHHGPHLPAPGVEEWLPAGQQDVRPAGGGGEHELGVVDPLARQGPGKGQLLREHRCFSVGVVDGEVVRPLRQRELEGARLAQPVRGVVDERQAAGRVAGHDALLDALEDRPQELALPLPLGFRTLPLGHVGLHADEVGDLVAAVADGGDGQGVPERGAVFSVVEDLDGAGPPLPHRLAELGHRGGVGLRALQESAVSAEDLPGRVAGQLLEAGAGVDDRVVGQVGVGDEDALGDGLDGPVAQPERRLGILAGGDVLGQR